MKTLNKKGSEEGKLPEESRAMVEEKPDQLTDCRRGASKGRIAAGWIQEGMKEWSGEANWEKRQRSKPGGHLKRSASGLQARVKKQEKELWGRC